VRLALQSKCITDSAANFSWQNKANGSVGSSKETTTANGQQQRSFSPRRLLMYKCSQTSSGSTKRTSVSHSHCQNYQQKKLKKVRNAKAIDLSMGYYHIPLDKASQHLCTTVLPWGKVSQMQRGKVSQMQLPMGVDVTPDIFQSTMMDKNGRHRARSSKHG
jgi:hypothetical protein